MTRSPLPSFLAALVLLPALPAASLAAWPSSSTLSLPVCLADGNQQQAVSVSDGAGGVIVTWVDGRSGTIDIYAQHVLPTGVVDPAWPVNGRLISGAVGL